MTKEFYAKKLDDIKKLLHKKKLSEADQALSKLEKYKPVPLKLSVLRAEYYLLVDDYYAFRTILDNKWWANYAYEGIDETLELYERLWQKYPNEREVSRNRFMRKLVHYIGTETKEAEELYQEWGELGVLSEDFYLNGKDSTLSAMERLTYRFSDIVWNYMMQLYIQMKPKRDFLTEGLDWIESVPNMGYLKERMQEVNAVFILVADETNVLMCRAMGRMLQDLQKTVYLLEPPIKWPGDIEINETVLLEKSIELNSEDIYGIKSFATFFMENEAGQSPDNRALLIQYLFQKTPERLVTVIGSGSMLDDLSMQDCLKKSFSRFNLSMGDIFENNFSFGWAGDYVSYISKIYNYDVSLSLQEDCRTYRYSIVIPTRNSAEALKHTLKTCLELDYPKDTYEIVISDNSTENNMEVYNLCQEVQDPRIKYYRTPRDLHLSKSFEYAFLQAKGEFIFSIGSDDAVLPWALKVLDEIRKKYPQNEIIQWERGFYAWPGFNGGQQNQFVIPRGYKRGQYNERYIFGRDYMEQVLQNPQTIYALPMLYINSGFKRSYINTLIQKTGRLWDGICQDIYMGVVNIIVNEKILCLQYPLTIAGMTNGSVGATYARANTDNFQAVAFDDDERKTGNIGGFSMSMIERLMPQLRSDVSSFYNSLLRTVAKGILPEKYMWEHFNWKKMFFDCIRLMDIRDVEYDKLIHYARYTASWHGQEFLQWFDEEIYSKAIEPKLVDERAIRMKKKKKTYQEGETAEGGLIVDASKYGVANSYEAMRLFQKLSGL